MTDHTDPQRRTMLRNTVAAAAVLGSAHAAGAATAPPALDKPLKPTLTAFESQAGPKPLAFDPAKLNGLSEKIIRSHWENNYGGSVKALAVIKKRLSEALADKDLPPYVYNDLKREHLLRTGVQVVLVLNTILQEKLRNGTRPDVLINPPTGDFGPMDFTKAAAIIAMSEPGKDQVKRQIEAALEARVAVGR